MPRSIRVSSHRRKGYDLDHRRRDERSPEDCEELQRGDLETGAKAAPGGAEKIIWEHGRRNFSLRADGVLSIVCPIRSEDVAGLYIFDLGTEETVRIMRDDPGFQAGVFSFDVYPCRGFPGNSLPG